jgi:hypothetical protein
MPTAKPIARKVCHLVYEGLPRAIVRKVICSHKVNDCIGPFSTVDPEIFKYRTTFGTSALEPTLMR